MNRYRPTDASVNAPGERIRRYIHAVAASVSAIVVVPLTIYLVAFLMFGDDVPIRFTWKPQFWLPVLVSAGAAGFVAFPFKRMRIWVATLLGPVVGLGFVGAYFVWRDL